MAEEKEMTGQPREEKAVVVDAPPPELVQHLDDKILKHSHDADAAMKAFEGYEGQTLELSEETNRRLLRKIDWHLMPVRGVHLSLDSYQQGHGMYTGCYSTATNGEHRSYVSYTA